MSAVAGVVVLLTLAFVREGALSDRLALVALVAIGFATALGWWHLVMGGQLRPGPEQIEHRNLKRWLPATIAVVVIAGLAVQLWFRPGTAIATGDIGPPVGTAWLGRLFEPWTWTGSSLGEPSQLPLLLPWAAVLGVVQVLGGDPELAQRIWYTTLFIAAGLGAFGLIAALRMGPGAALVGTAVYLLNPYMVDVVGTNAVYIAALGLLAAMPAALVAAGTGRLSVSWGAALIALAAPMLGYVDANPPLVGMVFGAMLAAPLVAGWVGTRQDALRSLQTLSLAIPLLLAASAYWIVPAIIHLPSVASDQLATLSSWNWTEGRATIRNGFWLNAIWSWGPEYFPFAHIYDLAPLSLARFALPALAFGALALGQAPHGAPGHQQRDRALRLAVAAATGAILIIFVSTGTNPPGNLAFDLLYRLPLGWLLREPGRFLMAVSLAYAVLVAVVVDTSLKHQSIVEFRRLFRCGSVQVWRGSVQVWRGSAAPVALGTTLCLGFPLYTGAVVPDSRPALPSAHVQVPAYWTEMARVVDGSRAQGALLVMPPDDFYQMPYTWGYYGNDGFIPELFHRPVLVPSGQGYSPASSQVVKAVNLTARSILSRDWSQTEALVRALDTPLILVRRDIVAASGAREILSPNALAAALGQAPNFELVSSVGSLDLFALKGAAAESERLSTPVTINDQAPDLRLVSLLSPSMALVSTPAQAGMPSASTAPSPDMWEDNGNSLVWRPDTLAGRTYRIADLDSKAIVSLDQAGTYMVGREQAQVVYAPNVATGAVTVSVPVRKVISNGDFIEGLWQPVGDCNNVLGAQARPYLSAAIVPDGAPGGFPALRLSASVDSACESQQLDWHSGPLVVSLMTHRVDGDAPRLCIWETGPDRCAAIPSLTDTSGWSVYRTFVTPDVGTTSVSLFMYADASVPSSSTTVSEYARVRVVEVVAPPSLALLSSPDGPVSPVQLVVVHNSFSAYWESRNGKHVLVDGMLNGWLVPSVSSPFVATYRPANLVRAATWISLGTALLIVLLSTGLWIRATASRHLRRRVAKPQSH
jgi:arabinofuranan 3-O-arabinosyltransferase